MKTLKAPTVEEMLDILADLEACDRAINWFAKYSHLGMKTLWKSLAKADYGGGSYWSCTCTKRLDQDDPCKHPNPSWVAWLVSRLETYPYTMNADNLSYEDMLKLLRARYPEV